MITAVSFHVPSWIFNMALIALAFVVGYLVGRSAR